jgi:hypothetical protein
VKVSSFVRSTFRSVLFGASLLAGTISLAGVASAGDKLPYDAGTTQVVTQDWNGTVSHSTYGKAIDLGLSSGTNVRAVTSGTVVYAGWVDKNAQGYCPVSCWLNGFGNTVYLQSTDGTKHDIYAHLSQVDVVNGQTISQGQILGKSGQSGWGAAGPHLHFQRKLNSIAGVPGNSVAVTFDENSTNQPWTSQNTGLTSNNPRQFLDLDGNSQADLAFQHSSGQVNAWWAGFPGGNNDILGNASGWSYKGMGYGIKGIQKAAIIWMHPSGQVNAWFGGRQGDSNDALGNASGWEIKAICDLNGDNQSEIIFQDPSGAVNAWWSGRPGGPGDYLGNASGFDLKGCGNFNSDNNYDLVFQHPSGAIHTWWSGRPGGSGDYLGNAAGWNIGAIVDISGDFKSEIILQHPDGSVNAWFSGRPGGSGDFLGNASGFKLVGGGYFNPFFKADLVFQNTTNGNIHIWLDGKPGSYGSDYRGNASGWSL